MALPFISSSTFAYWNKLPQIAQLPTEQPVLLTTEEQLWLAAHQPIRIAFDGNFPPYSFINDAGQLTGIAYDTIQLISQKLQIQIAIDKRTLWKDAYLGALNKEIDVIATMVNRPDRKNHFTFTQPYIFKSLVIVSHKSNQVIKNHDSLSGKTVALVKDYQYTQDIIKSLKGITPYYVENASDALLAVDNQQTDAAISFFATSYFAQNKFLLNNIRFSAFYERNSSNESIAVRSDWPILASIFQKGLNAITETEKQTINQRWYSPIELVAEDEINKKMIISFSLVTLALLLWIGWIKRQNRQLKINKNKQKTKNIELTNLKENISSQALISNKQLDMTQQKYSHLVAALQDNYFFYQYNLKGTLSYISPSISTILGYSTSDFTKHYPSYLTEHPDNKHIVTHRNQSLKGEQPPKYNIEILDKTGNKHCLEILETPLYDNAQQCIGLAGIAHDITHVNQTQEQLSKLSYFDELTKLMNRLCFIGKLKEMTHLAQQQQKNFVLLVIGIDRFKIINNSLGHAAGDAALKETALRLQSHCQGTDIAARIGGDEFALMLLNTPANTAEKTVKQILQNLRTPITLNTNKFILSSSIGIANYPQDGIDGETLLQQAENAMYSAKKEKKGYAFCTTELHQASNRQLVLEQALRKALAKNCYDDNFELQIVYQSKHYVANNKIHNYEALIRWQHPDLGLIEPEEFIALAKKIGLITKLNNWAITRVCLQAVCWSKEDFNFGKISVNISPIELLDMAFADNILKKIDATGARREWIELEINESAFMKKPEMATKIMQRLVDSEVHIAIDNFGAGHSSLSELKNLPATHIKIDPSFIRHITNNQKDQAVVRAIISMSHDLGQKVIAQGVETQEQLQFLVENNCDLAQGYWFSKPVTAQEIMHYVSQIYN